MRLLGYVVAVLAAWLVAGANEPAPVFGLAVAAAAAVVGSPALLLSLEGIGEALGLLAPWSEGLDDVEDLEEAAAP